MKTRVGYLKKLEILDLLTFFFIHGTRKLNSQKVVFFHYELKFVVSLLNAERVPAILMSLSMFL